MREHPQWLDDEAGPVVRPYAIIRGRTRSSGDMFDLIATVRVVREPPVGPTGDLGPEQQRILRMARGTISVADVASELDLPIGVVRVLLGDMRDNGLISVTYPVADGQRPSAGILKEVINGLRAL
jgi:hypothetical protein